MDTPPPLLYKSVHVTFEFWDPKTPPPPTHTCPALLCKKPPPPPRCEAIYNGMLLSLVKRSNDKQVN